MNLDIQFKLKSNPNYKEYIRNNSHWYKILNRTPEAFNEFEEEVKDAYKLRPTDRISKALESIEFVQSIFSILN